MSNQTEIGETWIELDFKEVDTQKKDKYFLALVVESPFDGGFDKKGIKTPEGEIVNPEIKLVNEKGDAYGFELCRGGSYGFNGKLVGYCPRPDIPKGIVFQKLLIKSEKPIRVKSIIWRGYDIKDLK
ncbi:MAG: hypothetical protein HC846_13305 [Blastocatellia bacterium]|nr:hypothetical protein [Blastocatellia bacterium]